MTRYDDEDWLYRRGPHSGQADDPERTRVLPSQPDPASRGPRRGRGEPLPPPTPVGHYDTPGGTPTPAPPAPPPPAPRGRRRRRRRPLRTLVLLLALFLAYLVVVPLVTWTRMDRADATPEGDRPANTPGTLFVLAGSDSREGLSPEEQAKLGTGDTAGRRTDTIMLLYVPTVGRAALISVPRDSYVPIPGRGKNKINAAYAFGGPKLLVATVEQATGLRVDGYAEIGFGGFASLVDAVGGVELCPEKAIKDPASNLDIQAGCQTFDGPTALGYVRMRKQDPLGDLGRVQRQREVLGVLAKKVASPATVLLPWRYWGVNQAGSRAVTVGADDGVGELAALATGALRIASGDGITLTVPVSNPDLKTPAGSAVAWDDKAARQLFAELAAGNTADLDRFATP